VATLLQDLLAQSAESHSGLLAIDDGSSRLSYAELQAQVYSTVRIFEERGLRRGDRVAVFSANSVDYVAVYFACAYLGLVIVPLNAHLKTPEIKWILSDCTPAAVVVELPYVQRFAEALTAVSTSPVRFVMGGEQAGWEQWPEMSSERDIAPVTADADENTPAIQMYTSGTTGNPKGVVLTHRNMVTMVTSWLEDMPLQAGESRFMQATPLFHVGGLLVCLSSIASGAGLFLLPAFEPQKALTVMTGQGITDTLLVPAMIQRLLALPEVRAGGFSALKTIVYGASLMPTTTLKQAREVFACDFLQGYGLTETSGVALRLTRADHRYAFEHMSERLASAGKPVSCCEVRITASDGRDVSVGEVGEILVRGSNVMTGYWNNSAATTDAVVDGWLHTGDLGRFDDEGYVYVAGRLKEMIDYCGENVYPAEVEEVLSTHPGVAEVAVIGLPHPDTGEEVIAAVVSRGNETDSAALISFCRQHLANFKCPARVVYCGSLPRTPAGKVQKHILAEQISSGGELS